MQTVVSEEGLRLDGRRAHEVRRVVCELGIFDRVDGSARYEQGNNVLLASVFGPQETKRSLPDRAVVRVDYTTASFAANERKAVSKVMKPSKSCNFLFSLHLSDAHVRCTPVYVSRVIASRKKSR